MAKRCPHCGAHDNPAEYEFCRFDGYELVEEGAAPPPPVYSPAAPPPAPPSAGGTGDATRVGTPPIPPVPSPSPPRTGKAKLQVMVSGQKMHEFTIAGSEVVIGRWDEEVSAFPEIDLSEFDAGCFISRHHARIYLSKGQYYIEDLGSANKTIINKTTKLAPHTSAPLNSGDEIIVGKTFLKFVLEY